MAGYTRQSSYTDGDVINAADSNDEFNQVVNVFSNTGGHKHDGTAAEGPVIGLIGDPGVVTPKNKVVVDDSNNRIGVFVDVSSSPVEQVRFQDGAIVPVTDDDVDLGASGAKFKDLYIDGTATVDAIVLTSGTAVTSIDTNLSSVSSSDDTLASAKAIKTYIDAQATAQDLDVAGDSGTLDIDLDSEALTIAGGTGIGSVASGTTVTLNIDATVATLAGSQTLTNKTLTTPALTPTATAAGSIVFKEGTNNGTNTATLIGPAATDDVVLTLPASTGTVALTSDIPAASTFGISNTNAVKIDSASVADDEYARFTSSGLESRATSEVLSDIGGQAALTFGISNTNAVKVDSASVADDEYARFTANGLESRSTSEVLSDIGGASTGKAIAMAIVFG